MATVEDIAIQAIARCAEYSDSFPTARSVLYRRIGVRQQQLFAAAARANPEYFGATADGTLDSTGLISLSTLGDPKATDPAPNMELISKILVSASQEGAPDPGTEIHVVPITDPAAALPPRLTIRGGVFEPVGDDLNGVTAIRVYYSHRPFRTDYSDGNTLIELPEPFHDLLVADAARFLLRKMATLSQEVRQVALAALQAEEQEALANFLQHVASFTMAVERGRFSRTQGDTKQ